MYGKKKTAENKCRARKFMYADSDRKTDYETEWVRERTIKVHSDTYGKEGGWKWNIDIEWNEREWESERAI